jgi:hypothetical protein
MIVASITATAISHLFEGTAMDCGGAAPSLGAAAIAKSERRNTAGGVGADRGYPVYRRPGRLERFALRSKHLVLKVASECYRKAAKSRVLSAKT